MMMLINKEEDYDVNAITFHGDDVCNTYTGMGNGLTVTSGGQVFATRLEKDLETIKGALNADFSDDLIKVCNVVVKNRGTVISLSHELAMLVTGLLQPLQSLHSLSLLWERLQEKRIFGMGTVSE